MRKRTAIRFGVLHVCLVSILLFMNSALAQQAGEYRSRLSGNWGNATSWERYNGSIWQTATSYPGQNVGDGIVTIYNGHDIVLNVSPPNSFVQLIITGVSEANRSSMTLGSNRNLNVMGVLIADHGEIGWSANSTTLFLPAGAVFTVIAPGRLNTDAPCNNTRRIDIGGTSYAACAGGGNVVYTFTDINVAGGTLGLDITAEPDTLCAGQPTLLSAQAYGLGYQNAVYSWTGTGPGGYNFSFSGQNPELTGPLTTSGEYTFTCTATVTDNSVTPPFVYSTFETATVIVYPLPTLGLISPYVPVCHGFSADILLDGLLPGTTFDLVYTIGSGPQTTVSGILAGLAGEATFTSTPLEISDHLQSLEVEEIIINRYENILLSCAQSFSGKTATLLVDQTSQGGSATAIQTVLCYGNNTEMSLAGFTGDIQWQQYDDVSANWQDVMTGSGQNTSLYNTSGLLATSHFRAKVTSGVCVPAYSNTVTIHVDPLSEGGIAVSDQTICANDPPSGISLSGYTGTIQWQVSEDNALWNDIPGALTAGLSQAQTGALTTQTYYRAAVTSGVCPVDYSNSITVVVQDVTPGEIGSSQIIAIPGTPALFTELAGASGSGTLSYQWQESTTGCSGTFTDIIGATGYTYQAGILHSTTQFRRIARSTLNGIVCEAFSNCITVGECTPALLPSALPDLIGQTSQDGLGDCTATLSLQHPDFDPGACLPVSLHIGFTAITPGIPVPTGGSVSPGSMQAFTFHAGTTAVSYSATDQQGYTSSVTFNVDIADDEAPQISLVGATDIRVCMGTPYQEAGATAWDHCEGDLTSMVVVTGQVDIAQAGIYTIYYNVQDLSGNAAQPVTRSIEVLACPFSGQVVYRNAAHTPLPGVGISLWQEGIQKLPEQGVTETDASGNFSFSAVPSGSYEVRFTYGNPTGGINATDAARIHAYQRQPYPVGKVVYKAGEADTQPGIQAGDAAAVLSWFMQGATQQTGWVFWVRDEVLVSPPWEGGDHPVVHIGQGPASVDFYGLVRGDKNGSYIPVVPPQQGH